MGKEIKLRCKSKLIFIILFGCMISLFFLVHKSTKVEKDEHGGIVNRKDENRGIIRNPNLKRNKGKLLLVVAVVSLLERYKRRASIRSTWFKQCHVNPNIVQCRFFSDDIRYITDKTVYEQEQKQNKDIIFMPIKSGYRFSARYIWIIRWYLASYDFDYILRVDDDYFLCMNRVLMELYHRPKHLFWGYLYCDGDHTISIDEAFMVVSKDFLIESLDKYNTTLICYPWADISVVLWLKETKFDVMWHADNDRLFHKVSSRQFKNFLHKDLCQMYIGLHGTYQKEMIHYWVASEAAVVSLDDKSFNESYVIPPIPRVSDVCKKKLDFHWQAMPDGFRFEPKLCKNDPEWSISNIKHMGREKGTKA